jgi:uncharacterized protein YutE (UPF0331/DUF86 family)
MTARLSKAQRRIGSILQQIPAAREQLLVAIEDFGESFEQEAFLSAALSPDARERNKVAVVEREYEVLLNWLHELAARGLAEGQRLGVVDKSPAHAWDRLAALGVISHDSAARLQRAKELRDMLGHAYPSANWRSLHEAVLVLVDELDRYLLSFERWAEEAELLPLS